MSRCLLRTSDRRGVVRVFCPDCTQFAGPWRFLGRSSDVVGAEADERDHSCEVAA